MFEYKKTFPASMPKGISEKYFLYYGTCAADKIPENIIPDYTRAMLFLKADPSDDRTFTA